MKSSYFNNLVCTYCFKPYPADVVINLCPDCQKPIFAQYDLDNLKTNLSPADLLGRRMDMWRYWELLPVKTPGNAVTLGEGLTPVISVDHLCNSFDIAGLFIKDESQNPTGSFKARGLSMAMSRCKELGISGVVLPSAGNAGSALSAYAARANIHAHIFLPSDTPKKYIEECRMYGADVNLIDGLIDECGRIAREFAGKNNLFDLSTLKEPYRIEGKKTMGLEIAEQFRWELPDVIIYPTGGGTGLIGMWKAFRELEQLGWISNKYPRMVVVQADGCAPLVKAYENAQRFAQAWVNAHTEATGIRVPAAVGDFLISDIIKNSGGTAVSVSETEMSDAQRLLMSKEGLGVCLEGAATYAALTKLSKNNLLKADDKVLIYNTGTPLKNDFPALQ